MGTTLFEIWMKEKNTGSVLIEIERRLTALETAREAKNDAMVFDGKLWQSPKPPTPQPIRIRPEDMVMVKWVDLPIPRRLRFGDINVMNNDQIEYISPIQPVRREWMKCDGEPGPTVWKWNKNIGKVVAVHAGHLDYGDLWQPVLSPDEPAPEGPEVKK